MGASNNNPRALLLKISKGSRALYLFAFVFMFLSVFCNFLLPQAVRFVVDNVLSGLPPTDIPFISALLPNWRPERLRENLFPVASAIVGVAALGGLFSFLYRQLLSMSSERMIKRLRDMLYGHVQYLPWEWHVSIQTGDIIQRCTSDVEVVYNFIFNQLIEIARTIALVFFAYAILLPLNLPMALSSMLFLPIIFGYSWTFLRRVSDRFLAADEAEGELLSIAQENFTGVRVVRAFGRERYEADRFDAQNRLFTDLWVRLGDLLSTYWGLGDLFTGLQMITICAVGAFQAEAGRITAGEFMLFLTCNAMVVWPVRGLGRVLSEASKTGVSVARLREILNAQPETDPNDALESPIGGDIVFDRVNFAYGGTPVLRDISFTVKEGTTLGILGATGSGKTTVAHLLCRLYDLNGPERGGSIRIGGVDIRRYRTAWLRKNVGIVLQEPFLFSRTIRENVAALSPDCPMERIREAAAVAQIDGDVEAFSQGYETVVGERGVTLSGGQKQRVAIARTVLREPPIVIFDDSLSAVDTETDAHIRTALAAHRKHSGATTLIISHRIASIAGADRVIVMEAGRIAEMGSPAELMAQNGIYRRIRDMQQNMEEEVSQNLP